MQVDTSSSTESFLPILIVLAVLCIPIIIVFSRFNKAAQDNYEGKAEDTAVNKDVNNQTAWSTANILRIILSFICLVSIFMPYFSLGFLGSYSLVAIVSETGFDFSDSVLELILVFAPYIIALFYFVGSIMQSKSSAAGIAIGLLCMIATWVLLASENSGVSPSFGVWVYGISCIAYLIVASTNVVYNIKTPSAEEKVKIRCGNCSALNDDSASYCSKCGKQL